MPGCLALSILSAVSLPIVRAICLIHNSVHKLGADYGEGLRTCPEAKISHLSAKHRAFCGVWRTVVKDHELGCWRRGRDSNPRYGYPYAAFRVRCFQPLSHLSVAYK